MKTRRLGLQDLEELLALMDLHAKEFQGHLPYEPDILRYYIEESLQNQALWFYYGVFSGDDKAALVGYAFGTKEPYFFNRCYYFITHAMYVHPDNRGGWAGKSLIKEIELYARVEGCVECFLSVTHGINHEKVLRLYGALGYTPVGGSYRKSM